MRWCVSGHKVLGEHTTDFTRGRGSRAVELQLRGVGIREALALSVRPEQLDVVGNLGLKVVHVAIVARACECLCQPSEVRVYSVVRLRM